MKALALAAALVAAPVNPLPAPPVAEKVAHCGGFLEGAAIDRRGTLWVVDWMSGAVLAVRDGKCEKRLETHGAPNGARLHKDGRLFVADNKRGILAIDLETMAISPIVDSYNGERIKAANDLAFDADGGLYITDPNGSDATSRRGRLFYLPPGGKSLRLVADGLSFPNGVALSADGKYVFVGQFTDKSVLMIPAVTNTDPLKASFVHLRTVGGFGPDGMALDADGRLYWALFGSGSVGMADPSGRLLPALELPADAGRYVTNVALSGGWIYVIEAQKGEVWRFRAPASAPERASK